MPYAPTADQMQSLLSTLNAPMMVANYGDGLRVIATALPGKAVCAILKPTGDGVMRIVYDPEKPHAVGHTYSMLRSWWLSKGKEPCDVDTPPDSVEFVQVG